MLTGWAGFTGGYTPDALAAHGRGGTCIVQLLLHAPMARFARIADQMRRTLASTWSMSLTPAGSSDTPWIEIATSPSRCGRYRALLRVAVRLGPLPSSRIS